MKYLALAQPSTAQALAQATRGRSMTAFERRVIEVLHDPIFERTEGLRATEACALAYRRLRHLRERLDLDIAGLMSDLDRLLVLHEWVAMVDGTLVTILTIHFNLCIGTILSQRTHRADLQPILNELNELRSVGVFLATELAYGNNVQALETEAIYDAYTREFVINTPRPEAQKFMPNTGADGVPKLGVVLARLKINGRSHGVFPFIVRIRTSSALCTGVRVSPLGDKPDYALDNAITSFHNVRVPYHHWISGDESTIDEHGRFSSTITSGGRRFLIAMERVQTGKLCIAAGGLGMMRSALNLTLRYARQRKTFGTGRRDVHILQYRSYQRSLFEGIAAAYACAFILRRATDVHARSPASDRSAQRLLAIAKVFISSRAIEVITQCRERVGAQGLFSANRIISYLIQAKGVVTAEGDNEVLLVRMARELLVGTDYEIPEGLTPGHRVSLEAPGDLVGLLRERERRLVLELRARLHGKGRDTAMFDAWNELVIDAIELATLHVRRVTLEAFGAALDTLDEAGARAVLERLFRLLCLKELTSDTTHLLIEGVLDPSLAKRIPAERGLLAASLFADAELLSDAFDIPDALLGAPIAKDFIAAYDRMSSGRQRLESGFAPRGSMGDALDDSADNDPLRSSG